MPMHPYQICPRPDFSLVSRAMPRMGPREEESETPGPSTGWVDIGERYYQTFFSITDIPYCQKELVFLANKPIFLLLSLI